MCPYNKTHSHKRQNKIQFEFKFLNAKRERKKHHPNNYLLQFFEQFIRNNIEQQKQGVGMFTVFKKNLCVSVLETKSVLGGYLVM